MKDTVAVIGAGPAGLLAASFAAQRGKKVCLIEKNKIIAKKLLITGKGRCNVTNSADMEDFIANTAVNSSFMYSAFYSFTNTDLIELLEGEGLKLKEERGGRIFPVSDRAQDVRDTLLSLAQKSGVKILCAEVKSIDFADEFYTLTMTDKRKFLASSVIIATGGVSYPGTGSTGDGYRFAQKLGHTVVEPKASLVPLVTKEKYVRDLMGLSLRNISIRLLKNGKEVYNDFGEMLFTHFGVSGPMILSASSHIRNVPLDQLKLRIDMKPALDEKQLDARILSDFEKYSNRDFANALCDLLPSKMIEVFIKETGISPAKKVNSITKAERQRILSLLKGWEFDILGFRPIEEAIITSGGVNVKEISPKTMMSKLTENLYFAGEIIDVDAYTGGFNLQIAFSTAYLAGKNAAMQ